jgi:hypothetical protein
MRRRWTIAVLFVCIVGALFAILASRGECEPGYGGHPLSWWTERAGVPTVVFSGPRLSGTKVPANEAVLAIGTNGLPFYLRWIQYRPSFCMTQTRNVVRRLPDRFLNTPIAESILYEKQLWRVEGSVDAIRNLGPEAASAVPELTRLMNDPLHPAVALRAAKALGYVGDRAFMPLLTSLRNTNRDPQLRAMIGGSLYKVASVSTNASAAVPILIALTKDDDAETARTAVGVLGTLRLRPDITVPALIDALADRRRYIPQIAGFALASFGTNARPAMSALEKLTVDSDFSIRNAAIAAMMKIAPEQRWDFKEDQDQAHQRPKFE